jgi:hypothetical protein
MEINVNDELLIYRGGGQLYKHSFPDSLFTEGVRELAERYSCFWLIDAVLSHQTDKKVRIQPFQLWILKRFTDRKFILICEDGNGNKITEQFIPFSDFAGDIVKLYFTDNTVLLPSEY